MKALPAILLLAAVGLAGHSVARLGPCCARAAAAPAPARTEEPAPARVELARGAFEPLRVPRAPRGIPCPDGTFLPPLNGVTADDPIPPIEREPWMPPIGEVVGRWLDAGGDAWWITADGSAFTTRWETIALGDGRALRVVRLDQSDAVDEALLACGAPRGR